MKQDFTIKQNIPWFKTDYQKKRNWTVRKSPHYVFHYSKNSLAEKDIKKIITVQEQSYKKILRTLKLKDKRKINYYLYSSRKNKQNLMGDDGHGNAIWLEIKKRKVWVPKKFEVHSLYNNKIQCIGPHEDTHLLSLPLGVSIFLFSEGLAEFMDERWYGKDIDIWAKKYLKENKLYPIEFLVENKNWDKVNDMIAYPQVGSFVRFLINTYGIEKFKKVYRRTSRQKILKENIEIIEIIYPRPIEKLEKIWREYLRHKNRN